MLPDRMRNHVLYEEKMISPNPKVPPLTRGTFTFFGLISILLSLYSSRLCQEAEGLSPYFSHHEETLPHSTAVVIDPFPMEDHDYPFRQAS